MGHCVTKGVRINFVFALLTPWSDEDVEDFVCNSSVARSWSSTKINAVCFFFHVVGESETPHLFRSLEVSANPASHPGIYGGSSARCVDDLMSQPPVRESDWCCQLHETAVGQVFAGPWRTRSEVD